MRRLLASIHDVSPRSEAAVDRLAERLTQHLGAPRFATLAALLPGRQPDHYATLGGST